MKKTLALILTLCLCIGMLSACSAASGTGTTTAPATTAAPAGTEAPADTTPAEEPVNYPTAPITIIVCRAAGGSADVVARTFAPYLAEQLGVNVVVENVDGGSGSIGLTQAWRAEPDGYTLVLGNYPSYVLNEVVDGSKEYKMNGFQSVVGISGNEGNVLIVPADSQFTTVQELVDYANANPGDLNMAVTSGVSNSALAQAMFLSETGVEVTSIPYDSGNKCATAVIGKEVDVAVCSGAAIYSAFADGNVRVLATFGPEADVNLPGVPTFASIYGEEFAYDVVMGLMAPPSTPEAVLQILRDAAYAAVTSDAFLNGENGFNVCPRSAAELDEVIAGAYTLGESVKDLLG